MKVDKLLEFSASTVAFISFLSFILTYFLSFYLSRFSFYTKLILILLNIMFHAPMGRFQLELIYCISFIFHCHPIRWDDGGK
jgi:hypothetical protein